jgi:hypothetical protein
MSEEVYRSANGDRWLLIRAARQQSWPVSDT